MTPCRAWAPIAIAAFALLIPSAAAAWDVDFGRRGETLLPDSSKSANRQVRVCSRGRGDRTLVLAEFGRYIDSSRRFAVAAVNSRGRPYKRHGRIWQPVPDTPKYGTRAYPLAPGGALITTISSGVQRIRRYDSLGRLDRGFGRKGSVRLRGRGIDSAFFPLADGGFVVNGSGDDADSIARYDGRGRRMPAFDSRLDGWFVSDAAAGDQGSLFLAVTVQTGGSPKPAVVKLRADGTRDSAFGAGGVWMADAVAPGVIITHLTYGFGRLYAIATFAAPRPPSEPPASQSRIIGIRPNGGVESSSGVVIDDGNPGDGGVPERIERLLAVTASGVVFRSTSSWYTMQSFRVNASRWSYGLGEKPLSEAAAGYSAPDANSRDETFAPESSVVTDQGKSLTVCGSLGTFRQRPYGGTRDTISIRRLALP